jgi:Na+-transporting NADH:ubiquinone oxidoreductase subunit A
VPGASADGSTGIARVGELDTLALHRIRRGLDLPIAGEPEQTIEVAAGVTRAAVLGADYHGVRPTLLVAPGDRVRRGEVLFHDKTAPQIRFTAPASGRVAAIHRGHKRVLVSVVIELSEAEQAGDFQEAWTFDSYTGIDPSALSPEDVRRLLVESGMWTALRTRPFSRVPDPASSPRALFVTAMDTHPLAPKVEVALTGRESDFAAGITALAKLTGHPTYLCVDAGSSMPDPPGADVTREEFSGPHPAGTAGVHINVLDPVMRGKTVWHIGYQDVAAVGHLFRTGRLDSRRVIALAGPGVRRPRLLATRAGASTDELVAGELEPGMQRVVSGSVLGGRTAAGDAEGYLGRFHNQVTVLPEGTQREFLGWLAPGRNKFSITNAFASSLGRVRNFAFTTTTNGSPRPLVPIGTYEAVMPMDIEPTFLIRALVTGDAEEAESLGCLELDEEDLALATFVCPAKNEYGPMLREILERIERDG